MQTLMRHWDSPILVSEGRVVVGAEGWDVADKVLHVSEKLRLAATQQAAVYIALLPSGIVPGSACLLLGCR